MLRSSLVAAAAAILTGSVAAQELESSLHKFTGPIMDGGTLHVATGTWSRNVPQAVNLGPDVIYDNTANTGIFTSGGIEAETTIFEIIDSGRLPGVAGAGNRDNYNVNCVSVAYCTAPDTAATGPLEVLINVYNQYATCDDPTTNGVLVGQVFGTGLPGYAGTGAFACWNVEFDLSGGGEFCILAEGEGTADGMLEFDQFGIGVTFDPLGTSGYHGTGIVVGPITAGDRNWTAAAAGELSAPGLAGGGGGGTYYGPIETCVPTAGGVNSSGYDNEDTWWTTDRPNLTTGAGAPALAGCYWFGGYNNPGGCNADGLHNPTTANGHTVNAGLYSILQADTTTNCVQMEIGGDPGVPFCDPGNVNSAGTSAALAADFSAPGGTGLHLEMTGGPNGQFGYFLIGTGVNEATPLSISNGTLCLSVINGNAFGRYNTTAANSLGQFDASGIFQNLVGTSSVGSGFDVPTAIPIPGQTSIMAGETWHFQAWYRDTGAGVGQSNLSNGLSVTF